MSTNASLELDNSETLRWFSWPDYLTLCIMLTSSLLIGIYFRITGKNETTKAYLRGARDMSFWPVGASLIASFFTGVAFIAVPTEVYLNGSYILIYGVPMVLAAVVTDRLFLPVFYELQTISSYEYFELRFCRRTRTLASVLFTIGCIVNMPIVIYIPGVTFSQVSGLNIHLITISITTICVCYTVLGGIKAVLWTDLLQAFIMLAGILTVCALGISRRGGLVNIWENGYEGGRLRHFEMDPSPFQRTTFWSITIGTLLNFTVGSTNQQSIQRYLSLQPLKKARISVYIFHVALYLALFPITTNGLILYAEYHDCDPIKSKKVSKPDQMTMYYIMSTISNLRGVPGLFVAGMISAALSTLSSSLNSLSVTVYEDFISPSLKNKVSENIRSTIVKLIVIIMGAISISLVFVVQKLGLIFQLALSLKALTAGTILGLFSLGMFYPRANSKGALTGAIVSLLLTSWVVIGAQKAIAEGKIKNTTLPTSAKGCGYNDTGTSIADSSETEDDVFILYKLSFMYYSTLGYILVFIIGIPVSHLTDPPKFERMKSVLFSPCVRKYAIRKYLRSEQSKETERELLRIRS